MVFRWQTAWVTAAGFAALLMLAAPAGAQSFASGAPRAAPTTPVWTVPPAETPSSGNSSPALRTAEMPRYAVMSDGASPTATRAPTPLDPAKNGRVPPPPPSAAAPRTQSGTGYKPPQYSVMQAPSPAAGAPAANTFRDVYRLGTGDKLRVTVYGEPDLSGTFEVDSSGVVRLPLIGQVQATGLTVHDFEQRVTAKLKGRYLLHPSVSAEVTGYRPFFIIGEVNKPGQYSYVNGMNVVNAVALAGGYTYRADEDDVYVRRNGGTREVERPANEKTKIYPGDIIRVGERFF